MTLAQRIAAWLDPSPVRIQREMFELIVKAGRRCAHDLAHCSSDVLYAANRPEHSVEQSRMWHAQARHWETIFYTENGAKDYHAKLAMRVDKAERTIERLREHCRKHGIIEWLDDDIPF